MTIRTPASVPVDGTDVLAERVRSTWTAGDFGLIAAGYERGAAEFVTRIGFAAGEQVLDVACGTGNLALPVARLGATVTGLDIAANLLEQLANRALEEDLSIELDEGNCEAMPYDDASFDAVITMFGTMFAARPDRGADELVRVCRPGGRIIMANWTPGGFIGDMLRTTSTYVVAPSGLPSPLLWGDEAPVRERLRECTDIRFTRRMMSYEYPFPPDGVVDYFRTWYGPTKRAFDILDAAAAGALHAQLVELWGGHNRATDGTTRVCAEYLEVMATRP
jgi:SAM-dependent methyltransferase